MRNENLVKLLKLIENVAWTEFNKLEELLYDEFGIDSSMFRHKEFKRKYSFEVKALASWTEKYGDSSYDYGFFVLHLNSSPIALFTILNGFTEFFWISEGRYNYLREVLFKFSGRKFSSAISEKEFDTMYQSFYEEANVTESEKQRRIDEENKRIAALEKKILEG